MLIIGIVAIAIATKLLLDTQAFLAIAITTRGQVITLEEHASRDDDDRISYTYRPVVEFTASRGEIVQFTSKLGSNPPSFTPGQTVQVLYNPRNLDAAKIATFTEIWLATIIVAALGVIFSIVGIVFILKPS